MLLLVVINFLVRPDTDVVVDKPGEGGDKARRRQAVSAPLPQTDTGIDLRFLRQLVIQLRLVGMMQDVHHVGAAYALRVVDPGVGITAFLSLSTRSSATSSISFFVPKWIAPVGQVFTQAGS